MGPGSKDVSLILIFFALKVAVKVAVPSLPGHPGCWHRTAQEQAALVRVRGKVSSCAGTEFGAGAKAQFEFWVTGTARAVINIAEVPHSR